MRRRLLLIVAAGLPFFARCQTASYAPEPVLRPECKLILFRGLNLAYNDRYLEAEDRFDDYSRCDPADPIGEWRKSYSWYFRLRSEQKTGAPKVDAKTYADFVALAERGVKKAEAKIVRGENPDFYRYVIAEIWAVEAVMTFHSGGIGSYLKSRDFLLEVHRMAGRSRYQDAKYLRGFMNYQASLSFWGRRFLPSDRCGGLALVQEAEKRNLGIFSDDIRLVIVNIAASPKKVVQENQRECSGYQPEISFDELFVRYPHNAFLRGMVIGAEK